MSELKQIKINDTIFNLIEDYDEKIKEIRVYGILDKKDKCKNPLFIACDVLKYLGKEKIAFSRINKNFTKKESYKVDILIKSKKYKGVKNANMLTKYGLIRFISFCKSETKASICLREFIYCLFDFIDDDTLIEPNGFSKKTHVLNSYKNEMNSDESKNQLSQIDEINNNNCVYFIKNIETNNIKIGRTNDINKRLCTLQTGNDCELKIDRIIKCDTYEESCKLEKSLHIEFSACHIRGEWFKIKEFEF